MISVTIDSATIEHEIQSLSEHCSHPPMEAIGEVARASVDQNFATGGRPPWPHIKDATHEPLIKSGHLRASIEVVASDSDKIVDIGSDVDYAPYHQYGTSHIPARAFLELQSSDEKRIEDLLARHLAL